MKRAIPVIFAILSACGGGDRAAGPEPVASVSITSPVATLGVGENTTLTATARDRNGNTLAGRPVTWTATTPSIASVSAGGVVTAVTVGSTTITATVESKSAQTSISVTAASLNCSAVSPVTLAAGEVRVLNAAERALLCVPGLASGAEYALIPVNIGTAAGSIAVEAFATNTSPAVGSPAALGAALGSAAGASAGGSPLWLRSDAIAAGTVPTPRNVEFERALRNREREMRRTTRTAASTGARAQAMAERTRTGIARITDLPATPPVGTLVTLNASSTSACTTPLNRVSRVAAVSSSAIVIVDTTAPAGGFTDAEYLSIAVTFDTLVFDVDTTAFGPPFDMDGNGRVVLFFTTAVNQLTPPGSSSVIGGFFFERDIVPRVANEIVPFGCPTSNEGEMFYLPVVDPLAQFNNQFQNKATMLTGILAATVHEFQHLINASQRYYITPEIVESEETWLSEAMSHLAEELLYLRVAGLPSTADLNFVSTTQPQFRLDAMNAYGVDNLARYNGYLAATEQNSPYAEDDELETRGAGWALLRYALDQSPGSANTYLRALVDAPTQGIPNFNNVFASVGGLAGAMVGFATANFTDNSGIPVAPAYTHPSWNFRDWLPHFNINAGTFPLAARTLSGGVSQVSALPRGGSAYFRFRVGAGAVGGVRVTTNDAALATAVTLILVRTQ